MMEGDVAVRLIRRHRLTDEDDPLELVAIMDEAALRRQVGGTEVMRSQLEHMVMAAELPTVTLQVLPLQSGAHGATVGAFTLLSFPEEYNPELLYVGHLGGALHIEDEDTLVTAKLVFDQLRAKALNPPDSAALIEQILTELDD